MRRRFATKELIPQIIESYKSGTTNLAELSRIYNLNAKTITDIVIAEGLYTNNAKRDAKQEIMIKAAKEYVPGMFLKHLSNKYGLSTTGLTKHLKKQGVYVPPIYGSWSIGIPTNLGKTKFKLDTTAFDYPLTDEAAYWLGMLMADGCVQDKLPGKTQKHFTLSLKTEDGPHVEKLQEFLKTDQPIIRRGAEPSRVSTGIVTLRVRNTSMVDTLISYGVKPRKSLKEKAAACLVHNRHFWRGVMDGDGHVKDKVVFKGKNYPCHLLLVGSFDLLTQFTEFTGEKVSKTGRTRVLPHGKGNAMHYVKYSGEIARKVLHSMYDDATVSLDRKQRVVDAIFADEGQNEGKTTTNKDI